MTVIIILVVAVVLVLWVIAVQRKLVSHEEIVMNSMSQIGVQQSSRWDALSALVELVKSYNEHEYQTLVDTIAARKDISSSSSAADVEAQEEAIQSALVHVKALAEQYPELQANENYSKAMDAVNMYENQVRMSRMVYNDTVTRFNRIVRQIPDSFVASLLGFSVKEYLKVDESRASMPSLKI